MKIILKTIANVMCSILFALITVLTGLGIIALPLCWYTGHNEMTVLSIVAWVICCIICVLCTIYYTKYDRAWMPFEPRDRYGFIPKVLLPLILVGSLTSCNKQKQDDSELYDAIINYQLSVESLLDYEDVEEDDSVFNMNIGQMYIQDKFKLDSLMYERYEKSR